MERTGCHTNEAVLQLTVAQKEELFQWGLGWDHNCEAKVDEKVAVAAVNKKVEEKLKAVAEQ